MVPNCNSPNDRCAIWRISHLHGYILHLLALYLLLHLKTTDMDLSMTTTTIYDNQRSVVECRLRYLSKVNGPIPIRSGRGGCPGHVLR